MLTSGGSVVGAHDWGSRRIAFEIDHRPEAAYHLFQFEGDNALLDRLNHSLKITEGVLRFRIIRQRPDSPARPAQPRAAPGAARGGARRPRGRPRRGRRARPSRTSLAEEPQRLPPPAAEE